MNRIIRKSVFETNSSSSHSVSINNNEDTVYDTIYPNNEGKIIIYGGEFGRTFSRHNDVETKLKYAVTSVLYGLDSDILKEVIREHTGCDDIELFVSDEYDSPYWSYIDHESTNVCPRDKENLRKFLFDKNSWLFVAHDEGTPEIGFYNWLTKYTKNGVIEPEFKLIFKIPEINYEKKLVEFNADILNTIIESLDIRYNATNDKLELDSHYWTNREIYYESYYGLKHNIKRKIILLFNRDYTSHHYFKENYIEFEHLEWDERRKFILSFLENNIDDKEVCYMLNYTVEEL